MSIVSIAVLVYLGCCGFLYVTQRSAMYYPTREVRTPLAAEVRVESDGATLKLWHLESARASDAIIYFGGNAEDVAGNLPRFKDLFPGHDVYLVNYRGYGGSTGSPTEAGLYRDALAVYDAIRGRYDRVSVIGRSLGSAVAAHLAASRDIDKLVLVTPFDSIENVARKALPLFPVSWLLKDRYDTAARVAGIRAPVLLVIAERDEVIPRRRSEALAEAFPEPQLSVEVIPGAGHNTIDLFPRYENLLSGFFSGRLRPGGGG